LSFFLLQQLQHFSSSLFFVSHCSNSDCSTSKPQNRHHHSPDSHATFTKSVHLALLYKTHLRSNLIG
ncbi:unnamed protein product, partial [Prunus brigantina]